MRKLTLPLAALVAASAFAAEVKVDFDAETGPVKPVNAVGQPPMIGAPNGFSMLHYLTEAGIPYSRLHDVGGAYGGFVYVDIPNVFRDFDADVDDPKSYDFAFTDKLLKALDAAGVEPFYRLGVTIENYPAVARYRIDPPKDYAKWARICEHVIRHYTEGWANGPKLKITYWEIWNEADINPDKEISMMWHADFSEYVNLYEVTSKHLKKCFPHLKIGGFAGCGFYVATMKEPTDTSDERAMKNWLQKVHHDRCTRDFLAAVRDRKCPLDFFSYHSYASVEDIMVQIDYCQKLLESYGLGHVETWLDEWLPRPNHDRLGTAEQASDVAAMLIGMQNSSLWGSCIYDARCGVSTYSPLFNSFTFKPHKAYYCYTAFNELRKCGTAVAAKTDGTKGLWAAAAKGPKGAAVMIANNTARAMPLVCDFQGREVLAVRITDADRTDVTVPLPKTLPAYSFVVVRLFP